MSGVAGLFAKERGEYARTRLERLERNVGVVVGAGMPFVVSKQTIERRAQLDAEKAHAEYEEEVRGINYKIGQEMAQGKMGGGEDFIKRRRAILQADAVAKRDAKLGSAESHRQAGLDLGDRGTEAGVSLHELQKRMVEHNERIRMTPLMEAQAEEQAQQRKARLEKIEADKWKMMGIE